MQRGVSRRNFTLSAPLILFLLLAAGHVQAEEISFDEAIAISAKTPGVSAVDIEVSARQKSDASIPSNRGPLTLTIAPGRRLSPSDETGTEFSVGITQSWNLMNLSRQSRKAAKAERNVLAAERRTRALAARISAAQNWLELRQAEETLALVRAERVVIVELTALTKRAREAGLVTSVAVAEANAAEAEALRIELAVEGDRVSAALALSVSIGAQPNTELKTAGPVPKPIVPSEATIQQAIDKVEYLPQVALLRLERVASSAQQAEQRAKIGRNFSFGLQAQRESSNSTLLFATLGMTFGGADKAQRARSILSAQAQRQGKEAEALAHRLRAQLVDVIHELEHSEKFFVLVTTKLVPAGTELLEQRERALTLGEGTILEVLRSRSQVLAANRYATVAKIEKSWAQVHLWLLLAEIEMAETGEKR